MRFSAHLDTPHNPERKGNFVSERTILKRVRNHKSTTRSNVNGLEVTYQQKQYTKAKVTIEHTFSFATIR